jgi:hypothetical protein
MIVSCAIVRLATRPAGDVSLHKPDLSHVVRIGSQLHEPGQVRWKTVIHPVAAGNAWTTNGRRSGHEARGQDRPLRATQLFRSR